MDESALLDQIEFLLADGLATNHTERAYTSEQVMAVATRLQGLEADDLVGRLVVGGFTLHPYVPPDDPDPISQACSTCMYFEVHRRFCNLPELMLPVKPEWSCVLWRI